MRPPDRAPRRSPAARPRGSDALLLGAALLLIAALAAYFAGDAPKLEAAAEGVPLTVVVVDTSASVVRLRDDIGPWLVRRIRSAAGEAVQRGEDVAIVTAGEDATRRFGPSADLAALDAVLRAEFGAWLAAGGAAATDLVGAAVLAVELTRAPGRPPGRVLVLGDGVGTTGGDVDRVLDAPSVLAVELEEPGPPTRHDLAVRAVRAPDSVPAGVEVTVAVDVALQGRVPRGVPTPLAVRVDWELRATRATGPGIGEPPFLRLGTSVAALRTPAAFPGATFDAPLGATVEIVLPALDPGTATLTLAARLTDVDGSALDDALPGNDGGGTRWFVGDPARILVIGVGDVGERAARAFSGPAFEGFDVRSVPVEGLEAVLADEPDPDVLVTVDTPLASLPEDWLDAFVRERGGGWLHTAGWSRLRADGGALRALDALEPDREPRKPRDVHFLIDGSGSMRAGRWERARDALARLVPALTPGDRIALRVFTLGLGSPAVVYEAPAGATEEARMAAFDRALVDLRRLEIPGGATDIAGSLRQLVDVADTSFRTPFAPGERERLIVLLSDGRETVGRGDAAPIRRALEASGTRLVILQVDESAPEQAYLQRFLPPGDEVEQVGDLRGVYSVLQAAVEGAEPLANATLTVARPEGTFPGSAALRDALAAALDALGEVPIASALPSRPALDGGIALLNASDGGAGERASVALAIAVRGAGLAAGLSFPLYDSSGRAWAPEALARSAWLAPLLRALVARHRALGALADDERGPSASLEGAPEARLVVRDLPPIAREFVTVRASVLAPGRLGAFGLRGRDEPVCEVELRVPRFDPEAAGMRSAPRPAALDRFARGRRLTLRADEPRDAFPPLVFLADGPREWSGAPAPEGFRLTPRAAPTVPPAPPPPSPEPHAAVAWLAVAAALLVTFGAARA